MAVSWDSNSMSTLFSSLPSSNKGFFGTGTSSSNMLSDYYSIKNGSYGKLMKSYYNQQMDSVKSSSKNSDTDKTDKTAKSSKAYSIDTMKANVAKDVKSAADTLKTSANDMLDSKLYAKVSSTDDKGNTTSAVDTDKVYKAAKSFVDSYNNVCDKAAKSDNRTGQSNISSMNNYSRINSKALSDMGITIGNDNKLSIDEDKFKNADMNDVQSMFGARGGYGYQISALASSASFAASNTFSNGYNASGNINTSSASTFFDAV